ncbi:sensor histidine kinase [Paenibacillus filicis]|uniref:histidine kinase n=1 Tax=Paenibacillus gyeongsangnamensis TaxID=3388067 RepID=A0ABT4QEW2_9BACL|nr:sensor histidine kinase [Paenibacillus filicis]MCZ8515353.1 sensor histidine kinase [Paenibacillus filicis]
MLAVKERVLQTLQNASVVKKLFLVFCMISLIPLLISVLAFHKSASNALEQELGANTLEILKQVDSRLGSFIQETERMANMVRFGEATINFMDLKEQNDDLFTIQTFGDIRKLLWAIASLRSYLEGIYIINDHGLMVYANTENRLVKPAYDFQSQGWYKDILSNKNFRLYPVREQDYLDRQPVVSFAGRIFDVNRNQDRGTLLINFNPDVISFMSENIQLGKTGYVFLMTPDGRKVSPTGKFPEGLIRLPRFAEGLKQQDSGHLIIPYEGVKTMVSFYTSPSTGWKIVGVVPFDEMAEGIQNVRFMLYVIIALAAVLIAFMSIFLSRAITRPLKLLEDNMLQVESGNFTTKVEVGSGDEIGRLGRRFNRMVSELENMREEIYLSKLREYRLDMLHREAELKALQAQINPHFLYNTLNTITCIGEVNEVEEISVISGCLAKMFKYSISPNHFASLSDELDHVNSYIKIIGMRFRERIQYHLNVPDDLLKARVVKLTVQPIVENCVNHGLTPKLGRGNICIDIYASGETLIIRIADDGVGIAEQRRAELSEQLIQIGAPEARITEHIGLLNVRQRLHMHYAGQGILRLSSKKDQGTVVEISIPLEWHS